MAQSTCFKTFLNVTHGGVVGVALKRHALLYTVFQIDHDGDPTIFQVTDKGVESVFAPSFPSTAGFQECLLDVNPGLGQWEHQAGFVYVTQGNKIFEITPNGAPVQLFAQLSSSVDSNGTAITFDRVGTFHHDMILTDNQRGDVYRVRPAMRGTMLTPFVNVHKTILGDTLAVVPKSLGPHGGEIWVAAQNDGKVYSVSASTTPTVNTIASIPQAGNVSVIPHKPKEFGRSGGAYFAADWSDRAGRILECPKSAFRGLGGNVLIGQETGGGVSMIKFDGSTGSYTVSTFDANAFHGNGEGAAFVQHHHCDDDDDDDDDD